MNDIFDNLLVCKKCNTETIKAKINKEGFILRGWKCPTCNEVWLHPADEEEYKNFQKIKNKNFQVKLRMVGNSYTVSIPREIIEFHEIKRERLVDVNIEEPEKITLLFRKIRKIY